MYLNENLLLIFRAAGSCFAVESSVSVSSAALVMSLAKLLRLIILR